MKYISRVLNRFAVWLALRMARYDWWTPHQIHRLNEDVRFRVSPSCQLAQACVLLPSFENTAHQNR